MMAGFLNKQLEEEFWAGFIKTMSPIEEDILEKLRQKSASKPQEIAWQVWECKAQQVTDRYLTTDIYQDTGLAFIVCLDEAGNVGPRTDSKSGFDLLLQMHRAARLMGRDFGGILVIMDTLCRIPGIGPYASGQDGVTHQPQIQDRIFVDVMTHDLEAHQPKTIKEAMTVESLAHYGRPLWLAHQEAGLSPQELVALAAKKIVGGLQGALTQEDFDERCGVALFASRVCVQIAPWTTLSRQLVESYMAHLDGIDCSGQPHCSYPSDPILSLGAASLLQDRDVYSRALRGLNLFKYKNIDAGFRGELLTQILTLWACDSLMFHQGEYMPGAVPVGAFLKRLVTPEEYQKLEKLKIIKPRNAKFLNGVLNLNHYLELYNYTPTRADLLCCLSRGAGIVCKRGQEGIDLIIPVLLDQAVHEGIPKRTETTVSFNSDDVQYGKRLVHRKCANPLDLNVFRQVEKVGELLETVKTASTFVKSGGLSSADSPALSSPFSSTLSSSPRSSRVETSHALMVDCVSYILIQCKNVMSSSSRYNPRLETIVSLESSAGAQEASRKNSTTVRPYAVIGAYYTRFGDSDVYRLSHPGAPSNCLQFARLNGQHAIQNAWSQTEEISRQMTDLLKQFPDPTELQKGGAMWTALGHPVRYGTKVNQHKFAVAHEALDVDYNTSSPSETPVGALSQPAPQPTLRSKRRAPESRQS